jgi:purine-binding chemotaxis protein CheW
MANARIVASFIIKSEKEIEIAIDAQNVHEAVPVSSAIQHLPYAVSFLEGFMTLRDAAIPVINMKKRLGLSDTHYTDDAKVAVVSIFNLKVGLLVDDIKDVILADIGEIAPIPAVFQSGEGIFTDLIKIVDEDRTLELLNLDYLLGDHDTVQDIRNQASKVVGVRAPAQKVYSRFVVVSADSQDYGIPIDHVQEITFFTRIDDMFKSEIIEGAVPLRGQMIPVLSSTRLLQAKPCLKEADENTRVLVLNGGSFQYGLIVDHVREIISISEEEILPLPQNDNLCVNGIYQQATGQNIMLIKADELIREQAENLKSVACLKASEKGAYSRDNTKFRHLITADCYLVFSIGRNFAIQLKDVQEIIEPRGLMDLPAADSYDCRVLNLRGTVIPVVNLRAFYEYPAIDMSHDRKLIITRNQNRVMAIEVDRILTIYKQVQYNLTPSLHPQLAAKKDTLDRLIEFDGESGVKEHVLVVNIGAMMENHLAMTDGDHCSNIELQEMGGHA